jgi:hypothetical protein
MDKPTHPQETIIDFITGCPKPNCGAEGNRQEIERYLVEAKKYDHKDIEVDAGITLDIDGGRFESTIDLVVKVNGLRYMVIKCAAGSIGSREREVIAAARLLEGYQIPISVSSDGSDALVWDTVSGRRLGIGLDAIPSKEKALDTFDPTSVASLDEKRRERQMLIFRTYATRSCAGAP